MDINFLNSLRDFLKNFKWQSIDSLKYHLKNVLDYKQDTLQPFIDHAFELSVDLSSHISQTKSKADNNSNIKTKEQEKLPHLKKNLILIRDSNQYLPTFEFQKKNEQKAYFRTLGQKMNEPNYLSEIFRIKTILSPIVHGNRLQSIVNNIHTTRAEWNKRFNNFESTKAPLDCYVLFFETAIKLDSYISDLVDALNRFICKQRCISWCAIFLLVGGVALYFDVIKAQR